MKDVKPSKPSKVEILFPLLAMPSRHFVMNKSILNSMLLMVDVSFFILSAQSFSFKIDRTSFFVRKVVGVNTCNIFIKPSIFTHWVASIFSIRYF